MIGMNCEQLREVYSSLQKNIVEKKNYTQLSQKKISQYKQSAIKELENLQKQNDFTNFEQLAFYHEKFTQIQKALLENKQNKNQEKLEEDLKQIFASHPSNQNGSQNQEKQDQKNNRDKKRHMYKQTNSFMESQESPSKTNSPKKQIQKGNNAKSDKLLINERIGNFFEQKQRKKSDIGFKSLILKKNQESSIRSSHAFKKKTGNPRRDLQVKKLLEQNNRLHEALEKKSHYDEELNQFEKNLLKEEKSQCMRRINELEEQVEQLTRNNYKLKEMEKSRKISGSTIYNESQREQVYIPYVLSTQANDLEKICKKTKKKQRQPERKQVVHQEVDQIVLANKSKGPELIQSLPKSNKKPDNFILEELLNESFDNPRPAQERVSSKRSLRGNTSHEYPSSFDSFSMARTLYNNSSLFLNASKNLIAIDSITSTRNKVAFFKSSLVIVREEGIEIAFKKSGLDKNLSRARVIFYINNKYDRRMNVDIEYDYDSNNYIIDVKQKLLEVEGRGQGRQVVEISFISMNDIGSVIDAHFTVGEKRYDLWVPVCFIEWTGEPQRQGDDSEEIIVQPDRQFGTPENLGKLVPISRITVENQERVCQINGITKFGSFPIKLSWWERQLSIKASTRISVFVAFIMHHFK